MLFNFGKRVARTLFMGTADLPHRVRSWRSVDFRTNSLQPARQQRVVPALN